MSLETEDTTGRNSISATRGSHELLSVDSLFVDETPYVSYRVFKKS